MDGFNFITVPVIVAVVYTGIALLKKATGSSEKVQRFMPLIAAGFGIVLGIIAFYALPQAMPATDVFTAILVGGASGLAATGANQIVKQLIKFKEKTGAQTEDGQSENTDEVQAGNTDEVQSEITEEADKDGENENAGGADTGKDEPV